MIYVHIHTYTHTQKKNGIHVLYIYIIFSCRLARSQFNKRSNFYIKSKQSRNKICFKLKYTASRCSGQWWVSKNSSSFKNTLVAATVLCQNATNTSKCTGMYYCCCCCGFFLLTSFLCAFFCLVFSLFLKLRVKQLNALRRLFVFSSALFYFTLSIADIWNKDATLLNYVHLPPPHPFAIVLYCFSEQTGICFNKTTTNIFPKQVLTKNI